MILKKWNDFPPELPYENGELLECLDDDRTSKHSNTYTDFARSKIV